MCRQHPDTLPNLLTCSALSATVQKEDANSEKTFTDIFSFDVSQLKAVTELYMKLLEARETVLTTREKPEDPAHMSLFSST